MFTIINEMAQSNYTASYEKASSKHVFGLSSFNNNERQLKAFRKTELWGSDTFARASDKLLGMPVLLIRDGKESRVIARSPIGWVDVTDATERELIDLSLGNPHGDDPLSNALRKAAIDKQNTTTGGEFLVGLGLLFGMAVIESLSSKK